MNFRVLLTKEAEEKLAAVRNPVILEQLIKRIDSLQSNPEAGKPLRGVLAGYWSLRASRNRYRIIYRIVKEKSSVVVITVGLRKGKDFSDVYKSLERIVKRRKREI